jgi:hypothetical protein
MHADKNSNTFDHCLRLNFLIIIFLSRKSIFSDDNNYATAQWQSAIQSSSSITITYLLHRALFFITYNCQLMMTTYVSSPSLWCLEMGKGIYHVSINQRRGIKGKKSRKIVESESSVCDLKRRGIINKAIRKET